VEYSIVIPVYNSSKTLEIIYERVKNIFIQISPLYEIILVDDSSTNPETWQMMQKLRSKDPCIKIIQLRNNHGQQKAVLCGLMFCRGKYVITMDDDLQHPPEEIPKLIQQLMEDDNLDVVFGVPFLNKKQHNLLRNIGSHFVNKIDEIILRKPPGVTRGSFRIMRGEIAKDILRIANDSPTVGSLILSVTQRVKTIQIEHEPRMEGRSGYKFFRLVSLSLDNILNYSSLPLKLVAFMGLFYFVFSISLSIWVTYKKIVYGINVPGWTSLLVIQSLSGGIIMAGLGIIGEYLVRIIKNFRGPGPTILIRQSFVSDEIEK